LGTSHTSNAKWWFEYAVARTIAKLTKKAKHMYIWTVGLKSVFPMTAWARSAMLLIPASSSVDLMI
jgi:hypothetical protein